MLGLQFVFDAGKLALLEKGPATFTNRSPISQLSHFLRLWQSVEQTGVTMPNSEFLRILNPPAGCPPAVASLSGMFALDMQNPLVMQALYLLRGYPPEIQLLDRAMPTLVYFFHFNTEWNLEALPGHTADGKLARKRYKQEREKAFAKFTTKLEAYKTELLARSAAVNASTGSMYATNRGPLATKDGPILFPPAASCETAPPESRPQEQQPESACSKEPMPNWTFWEAPEAPESPVSSDIDADWPDQQASNQQQHLSDDEDIPPLDDSDRHLQASVSQLVRVTKEILQQFAANMILYYSGQGVQTGKRQRGRRAGAEPNPVWSQVEEILRRHKQGKAHADFAETMLIFRSDVWTEAIESASSQVRNSMKFKTPALDSIAGKCQLLSNLESPVSAFEAFAHAVVRILVSSQWSGTSAAVVFKRSLSSHPAEKLRQVTLFVRSTVSWFIALYNPHSASLVLPVLSASEKSLFLNRKHFWKFQMEEK